MFSQAQQSFGTLGDMFRFTWNHHQALFKNIDPIHIIIKRRYGMPYAYIEYIRLSFQLRRMYCEFKFDISVSNTYVLVFN